MTRKIVFRFIVSGILWLSCACSGISHAQDDKPAPHRIVLLTMSVEAGVHRVTGARTVDSPLPLPTDVAAVSESLNYAVTDIEGRVLIEGGIRDPQLVRSPLSPPGEPQEGHKVVQLAHTGYLLRLPYRADMRYLRLQSGAKPSRVNALQLKASAGERAVNGSGTIDLAPWLK